MCPIKPKHRMFININVINLTKIKQIIPQIEREKSVLKQMILFETVREECEKIQKNLKKKL